MTLNEYQEKAMTTCMDSCRNYSYMFDNLVAEVGEFGGKVAKMVRKGQINIEDGQIVNKTMTFDEYTDALVELMKEGGDIFWQLSGMFSVMCWELEDVAQMNLDKLASRKERGVIDGNGDNR